jgi:hypothetical protein
MSLQGIPGIYFNGLLGTANNLAGMELTGRARTINRRKWTYAKLDGILAAKCSPPFTIMSDILKAVSSGFRS